MKDLSVQELKHVCGAVSHIDDEEQKIPQPAKNELDADYLWIGLASVVSLLFAGWAALKSYLK